MKPIHIAILYCKCKAIVTIELTDEQLVKLTTQNISFIVSDDERDKFQEFFKHHIGHNLVYAGIAHLDPPDFESPTIKH